jgi:hypothetical protein
MLIGTDFYFFAMFGPRVDNHVAPALLAAQETLKRQKIEDDISKNLRERPPLDELVKKDILKPEDLPSI